MVKEMPRVLPLRKKKKKIGAGQIALHVALLLLCALMLYPLGVALWGAFKTNAEFTVSKWYPTLPFYFDNFFVAFKALWPYMLNTIFVGGVGTLGVLAVSCPAAYVFARKRFPGKNILFFLVIGLMMIPAIMTLVPSFMLYKDLVGTDTYLILIIPVITGGSVFATFLLRSFFEGIPEGIFEAARLDGAGDFLCFFKICLPLCIPILVTLAIMQLNGVWNDYIWPMIACPTDSSKLTIAAAIKKEFLSGNSGSYPTLFAGYLVSSLPLVALLLFGNKYYVEGLTNSAIKF